MDLDSVLSPCQSPVLGLSQSHGFGHSLSLSSLPCLGLGVGPGLGPNQVLI